MEKLAQELVDRIFRSLPARSIVTAANVFKIKHDPHHDSYIQLWTSIFKDETWLRIALEYGVNPLLIGPDLSNNPYMVLIASDPSGELQFWPQNKASFLACLQEHVIDEKAEEVKFKSGLTMNIVGVLHSTECYHIEPQKLFNPRSSRASKDLRVTYMFMEDEAKKIRTLPNEQIRGVRNKSDQKRNRSPTLRLKDVSRICGLDIHDLEENSYMHIFTMSETEHGDIYEAYFSENRDEGVLTHKLLGWDFK